MHASLVHLRLFHHWPMWVTLAPGMPICERCLKPPRRSNLLRLTVAPRPLY